MMTTTTTILALTLKILVRRQRNGINQSIKEQQNDIINNFYV
jgi:hypothetical protein